MDAITEAYDGDIQMSLGCDFKESHPDRCMGRSRGGLTTKITP
jgi:hypothetical protein